MSTPWNDISIYFLRFSSFFPSISSLDNALSSPWSLLPRDWNWSEIFHFKKNRFLINSPYFAGQRLPGRLGCPDPVQMFRSPGPWRRRTPSSSSHDPGPAAEALTVHTRMINQKEILLSYTCSSYASIHLDNLDLGMSSIWIWFACDWTKNMYFNIYL